MWELDASISWEELRKAIAKLANGKSPGLNDVPPDAFKALTDEILRTLLAFLNSFGTTRLISLNGTKSKWYQCQRVGILLIPTKGEGSH